MTTGMKYEMLHIDDANNEESLIRDFEGVKRVDGTDSMLEDE